MAVAGDGNRVVEFVTGDGPVVGHHAQLGSDAAEAGRGRIEQDVAAARDERAEGQVPDVGMRLERAETIAAPARHGDGCDDVTGRELGPVFVLAHARSGIDAQPAFVVLNQAGGIFAAEAVRLEAAIGQERLAVGPVPVRAVDAVDQLAIDLALHPRRVGAVRERAVLPPQEADEVALVIKVRHAIELDARRVHRVGVQDDDGLLESREVAGLVQRHAPVAQDRPAGELVQARIWIVGDAEQRVGVLVAPYGLFVVAPVDAVGREGHAAGALRRHRAG